LAAEFRPDPVGFEAATLGQGEGRKGQGRTGERKGREGMKEGI